MISAATQLRLACLFAGITEPEGRAQSGEAQTTRSIDMAGRRSKQRSSAAGGLLNYAILRHYHSHWGWPQGRGGGEGSLSTPSVQLLSEPINVQ